MNLKIKIISLFLFVPLLSFAQEFDSNFLNSLPDDVRRDLLNQVEEDNSLNEEQYRRPSTFIEKPQISSDRFGIRIFSMMQTTLMPINEPNFDADYVLDFGDTLQLQLIGTKSSIVSLLVGRDGSISVPDIGKIVVSGLSLEDASNLIKERIESLYIGVSAFVTLSKVRDIQIIVAGNVFNPGPYTLNGNSNIFHGLAVAGGPSELGSFRKISLIRKDNLIESIDLYDIFIYGKSSFGTRLRSGDTIFVNPAIQLNGVYGGVKREGVYELKDNETLSDLIFFGNGLKPDADSGNIFKEVFENGAVKNIKVLPEEFSTVNLNDGNNVFIRQFPVRQVEISGAVKNPGKYRLNDGDTISDVIKRSGGYLPNAYTFGGILLNQEALNANEYAKDELYKKFLSSIIQNAQRMQSPIESTGMLLQELKDSPVSGRIVTEFDLEKLIEDPSKDLLMQNGDQIIIPEVINHVYIFGEVANQGTTQFIIGNSFESYVDDRGGFLEDADLNNIFILHPNGISEKVKKKNLFRDGRTSTKIYPGSIIFVPRKPENILLTQSLQAYATILGNIGVSLASLSVIKD
tara:strand:+ start:49565 stop:51286 length:1722 start_codon:yes stop_codon:yes gene_type:complete